MNIHLVSLPHVQTTKQYNADAYLMKTFHFAEMMVKLGHRVYLYGSEENEAPCEEFIGCITKKQLEGFGFRGPEDYLKIEFVNKPGSIWEVFNYNVINEIAKRKGERDIICVINGLLSAPIAKAFPDALTVEYGVGYGGVFSQYKVFESYAWMHSVYAAQNSITHGADPHSIDGQYFDTVIPNFFDPKDFPFSEKKEDYFVFLSRMTPRKGYEIAIETTKRIGAKLIVAGGGGDRPKHDHVEYIGHVDIKKRGELLSKARAIFVPTVYVEPFGSVSVEANLCGTPAITTDWGAFTETVINGFNGYRCRTLNQFIQATKDIEKLHNKDIREFALKKYSMDVIAKQYDDYFKTLMTLWGDGWYHVDTVK